MTVVEILAAPRWTGGRGRDIDSWECHILGADTPADRRVPPDSRHCTDLAGQRPGPSPNLAHAAGSPLR
jgi:hypothetical protein